MRVFALAFAIVAALAGTAAAQHGHGDKGPNGGPMEDIAGVHAELITSGNAITINVLDENSKPLSTKGFSGSILIVTGAARETVTLQPSGDSALKGEAKAPVAASSVVSLVLKTDAGKSEQVRFKR